MIKRSKVCSEHMDAGGRLAISLEIGELLANLLCLDKQIDNFLS